MKNNNLKKGLFTALLLASPLVTAGTQYPAADFQPKVVYQDESYQHQSSGSSSSASSSSSAKASPDANYPAATFQPEVLFIDEGYKHSAGTVVSKSASLKRSTAAVEDSAATEAADDSSMNPLFAIVVLGVAGFLYTKQTKGTAKPKKAVAAKRRTNSGDFRDADGVSGVAKYLQNKVPKLSSVDKYLEANQTAPKSGVAKYVARRVVAAKKAASEKVTGVEKYMRNQNRG